MTKWSVGVGLIVLLGFGVPLLAADSGNDVYEGGAAAPSKNSRTSDDKTDANLRRIDEKLDEILKVQESILAEYDQVMEALRIAKVRVSR